MDNQLYIVFNYNDLTDASKENLISYLKIGNSLKHFLILFEVKIENSNR